MISPLNIAFTYDAISEWSAHGMTQTECAQFQEDETINRICAALEKIGTVDRVGTLKSLVKRLATGVRQPWDVVFNYSESFGGVGREGHVPGLLEAYQYNYTFSDSSVLALCMDKAKSKMVLDFHGIPTAPFACVPPHVDWPADASSKNIMDTFVWKSHHAKALRQFPLFIKPAADNSGVGIQQENKVHNEAQLLLAIERLAPQFAEQSILVERFLQGREFTVGILGTGAHTKVIGVMEFIFLKNNPTYPVEIQSPPPSNPSSTLHQYDWTDASFMEVDVYGSLLKNHWLPNPQQRQLSPSDPIAIEVAQVALDSWKALGCRDCGRIDIRYDRTGDEGGVPNFIEVNPIPGLTPDWSDLPILANANGLDFDTLIASIVRNALSRKGPNLAHGGVDTST